MIVLHGINDIGLSASPAVADELIATYRRFVELSHARGLRIYGATLLPFGGSHYDSPEHETARQAVNAWFRSSGAFDAVIDLDTALRDPKNPSRLLPDLDTGDHLHVNADGHRCIAEAIDLDLFAR